MDRQEVHSFLYEGGDNPFGEEAMPQSYMIFLRTGIEIDRFNQSYRRLYVDNMELTELDFMMLADFELEYMAQGFLYKDFNKTVEEAFCRFRSS